LALCLIQFGQGIETASKLEGPHALEIFALDENLRLQLLVQAA
jgi:hypothetical protein